MYCQFCGRRQGTCLRGCRGYGVARSAGPAFLACGCRVGNCLCDTGPSLGIDVTDGDLVMNLGDGLGVDLETGQVEADFGGFDIPL
jgi:hypothetical protein